MERRSIVTAAAVDTTTTMAGEGPRSATSSRPDRLARLAPLVVVLVGLAAYHDSFEGVFLFDDIPWIVENEDLEQLWPPTGPGGLSLRPVLLYTLALNHALGPETLWQYHAVNVAIHLLAGLTLLGVVRRALQLGVARRGSPRPVTGTALAIAVLWTVHPLTTQAVDYLIQRGEALAALSLLLVFYCYLRALTSTRPWWWYGGLVAVYVLGLGCKEVVVTAPVIIYLHDAIVLTRSSWRPLRERWWLYLTLVGLPLLALGLYLAPDPTRLGYLTPDPRAPAPLAYALNQPHVIMRYLGLALWPASLCLDHALRPASSLAALLPGIVGLLLLVAGTVRGCLRQPALGFLGASFLVLLAPTSSVMPLLDLMVEHRMYLPLAAVVTLVVLAVRAVLHRVPLSPRGRAGVGLLLVLLAGGLLGYRTHLRHADYRDAVRMWRDVTGQVPGNSRGHHNLAMALADRGTVGDLEEAHHHAILAVLLDPDSAQAYAGLASVSELRGKPERAITLFRAACRLAPGDHRYPAHLGLALLEASQLEAAEEAFRRALELHPGSAEAHHNLGTTLVRLDRHREARTHFEHALELDPELSVASHSLGRTLLVLGQFREAVDLLTRAVELAPEDPELLEVLGAALLEVGRTGEAVRALRGALQHAPDRADLHAHLALAHLLQGSSGAADLEMQAALRLEPGRSDLEDQLELIRRQVAREEREARASEVGIRWVPGDPHLHGLAPPADGEICRPLRPTLLVSGLLQHGLRIGPLLAPVPAPGETGHLTLGQALCTAPVILHPDPATCGPPAPRCDGFLFLGVRDPAGPPDDHILTQLAWAESQGVIVAAADASRWPAGTETDTSPSSGVLARVPALLALGHPLCLCTSEVASPGFRRLWYSLLDCGFRVPVVAGSGYPVGDRAPGQPLTLVALQRELTHARWIDGIRRGRTVIARDRSHLLACVVAGALPGDAVELPPGGADLSVEITTMLRSPDRVEVVVNSVVVSQAEVPAGAHRIVLPVRLRESAWLAVRTGGAHTGALYLRVGGRPIRASVESARHLRDSLQALLDRHGSGASSGWPDPDRAACRRAVEVLEQRRHEAELRR